MALDKLREHDFAHAELEHVVDTQAAYLLLRYSLSVRFHFLTGMVGPALAHGADGTSPLATHYTRLIRSLTFLLVDPTVSYQLREARVAAGLGRALALVYLSRYGNPIFA